MQSFLDLLATTVLIHTLRWHSTQTDGSFGSFNGRGGGLQSRHHSSPDLTKLCNQRDTFKDPPPSSVCVKDRSVEIEELQSDDGRFRFVMQPDRTLVLYMEEDAVWAIYLTSRSHPFEIDSPVRLVLQSDGNLVAVDSSSAFVWQSSTSNIAPGPYTLKMHNDGNCALYGEGGVSLWATRTQGWG